MNKKFLLFFLFLAILIQLLDLHSTVCFVGKLGIEFEANDLMVDMYNSMGQKSFYIKTFIIDIPLITFLVFLVNEIKNKYLRKGFFIIYTGWFIIYGGFVVFLNYFLGCL